jgi:hypothetical protein
METNGDIKAALEFARVTKKKHVKEMVTSLGVKEEAEWGGKRILFISFKREGVTKYDTVGFEKHADAGYWVKADVSTIDVRKDNKVLADQMERWEQSGSLEPKSADKK